MSPFLMPRLMSSNVLFCLTNNPLFKDIQFTVIFNIEKQQILTFEERIFGVFARKVI